MKKAILSSVLLMLAFQVVEAQSGGQYADIHGLRMYYEAHGAGMPLVLIHGGGSTIQTSFGKILPELARKHQIIAVELQAHGHTSDRDAPESFDQDAADVVELLRQLHIAKADILGFSNGGQTAMVIAMQHPDVVRKLVLASAFYSREGAIDGFWDGMQHATFESMPQVYKDAFLAINNDSAALVNMFHKDAKRMQTFVGWKREEVATIKAPTLIVAGDRDVMKPEHAVEMHHAIANSRLAIFPATHGSYMGEAMTANSDSKMPQLFVATVGEFLAEP